jgi:hypothetical protein
MSDRESVVQQAYKDDFERKIATKEAYFSRGFEIERQRMAFYDRLILLSAGTLTLSFTAATSFQNKGENASLLCGRYLTTEAILLAASIAFALAFSWLTLSSLVFSNRAITTDSSIANRRFSSMTAKSMLFPWTHELVSDEDLALHQKTTKQAKTRVIFAGICAVASLASFLTAYVFFFIFVYANLFRLPNAHM